MMETERRGHQKHRCKHCGKSFPSGRSLGGHMRCHAPPAAPATTSPASEPDDKPQSGRSLVGGFSPAYGLRQNPKKTWRISADDVPAHGGGDDKSCRECGKRFASWKSLFGHMRSHSLKQLSTIEQEEEEEEEEQQQQQEQEQEQEQEQQSKAEEEEEEEASRSRSDTVFGNVHVPRKRRRSRRAIASCSVSASEEYEKEDEEGAITLLMLSRDVRCWISGGLIHCVQESSDKNSAVVENKRVDLASDEGEETKKAKRTRRSQLDDSRNGRRSRGIKKVEESDASADNGLIGDHGFEQFDDSRKDPSSNSASEFWIKGEGSELEASLHGASNGDFDDGVLAEKRRRKSRSFECADCDKAFHSYQALGGHRASHHKRIDQKADLIARRGGSGKKAADHECLICGRSFASGQALGGHKKSHLGLIQQQKLSEKLLDLNIPASTTEGDCVSTNNGSILSSIYGGLAEAA